MKARYLFIIVTILFFLGIFPVFSSTITANSEESQNQTQVSDANSEALAATGTRTRTPRSSDRKKFSLVAFYQSQLKEYDINDFSTESLMKLMDNETSTIRLLAAM